MDVELLEHLIAELAKRFQDNAFHYFSERELQSEFFALCRDRFGSERPEGSSIEIPLFRHEYNTLWRHRRDTSFAVKFVAEGKTGLFDFAVLNRDFVRSNDLLTVINKDERKRVYRGSSTPLDGAIEFKMAHVARASTVSRAAIDQLRVGVSEDCRKLAHEKPRYAYMIAFSHGEGPNQSEAARILQEGRSAFESIAPTQELRLLVVTPANTFLCGPWLETTVFPKACPVGEL